MGPKKTHTQKSSWLDKLDFEPDQSSNWLDLYRRHLSWIKSSDHLEEDNLLKDIAAEM